MVGERRGHDRERIRGNVVLALAVRRRPPRSGVGLTGTTAPDHRWHRAAVREPTSGGQMWTATPSYAAQLPGLVDATGQPDGYVADVLEHYIIPQSARRARASPPRSCGTQRTLAVHRRRTFDKCPSLAGYAQLNNCLTSPADMCFTRVPRRRGRPNSSDSGIRRAQSRCVEDQVRADRAVRETILRSRPGTHLSRSSATPTGPTAACWSSSPAVLPIADISFNGPAHQQPEVGDKFLYPTADIARQYDFFADFKVP